MSNWKDFVDPDARGGRFLPWKEVARATGLSRTTAWRLQKRHEFPAPYAISPGRVGYREDEVEAWRVSRDHSAARPSRPTQATAPGGAAISEPALAARSRDTGPSEAACPNRGSAPPHLDRKSDLRPAQSAAGLAPRKPALRRRSQHAQAIAQQMRFDF